MAGRIPTAPPHGRTLHRLADPQQSQSPLPRRGQKRSLAASPIRGIEPAPTHHDGPEPHRHHLGHRLTRPSPGVLPAAKSSATLKTAGRPLLSTFGSDFTLPHDDSRRPAPNPLIQQTPRASPPE